MECQRYGCIPIVRKTGGLADTVSETDVESQNGFLLDAFTADEMLGVLRRAIEAFHNVATMEKLISNALKQRNSWDSRIPEYAKVYEDAKAIAVAKTAGNP
jgi:starch synthase